MASAKIGKNRDGKKVSMMKIDELRSFVTRGGKAASIAKKELQKRGVSLEDVVL